VRTEAEAIASGDERAIERVARAAIRLRTDNLIARPWGGFRLPELKGLANVARARIGESFEVAADPDDAEAGANPSIAVLADGSELPLPELLTRGGAAIAGALLFARAPGKLPLLPKFLDVRSLLSVQAHPAGNPECYVVLAADPGATIRLGFKRSVSAQDLIARCRAGRTAQERLLDQLSGSGDSEALNARLAPVLARRDASPADCAGAIRAFLDSGSVLAEVEGLLAEMRRAYWSVLDDLNEVAVAEGQVIFNATPARLRGTGPHCAEVHALGNPEEREILMLEIRKPGPTFRAWDHARFPLRPIAIERAVAAMNLEATQAGEFLAAELAQTAAGTARMLITCPDFEITHLRVGRDGVRRDTRRSAVTLHGIGGAVDLFDATGRPIGSLARGESVLLPAAIGAYMARTREASGDLIAVGVPGR
jgi:hypothetical protein